MISHSRRASNGVAPLSSSLCTSASRSNLEAARSASSAVLTTEGLATSTVTSVTIFFAMTYLLIKISVPNSANPIASSVVFGIRLLRYLITEFLGAVPYITAPSESAAIVRFL